MHYLTRGIHYIYITFRSFRRSDWIVLLGSITSLLLTFVLSGGGDKMTLITSLVGMVGIILVSKGNVLGQIVTIIYALLYSYVSLEFHYYGEMITYLGMTGPSAAVAAIAWIRHPHSETEVAARNISRKMWAVIFIAAVPVTALFYFVLGALDTPNLGVSTISITTSFLASALMFLRNRFYALAYMCNDLVLIVLWALATLEDLSYLPMVTNFAIFLINDLYGYWSWRKMCREQGV